MDYLNYLHGSYGKPTNLLKIKTMNNNIKNLLLALMCLLLGLMFSCTVPSQSREGQGLKVDQYGRLSTHCLQRQIKHTYTIGGKPLQNTVSRLNTIGRVVAINTTDSSTYIAGRGNMPLIVVCYRLNAY